MAELAQALCAHAGDLEALAERLDTLEQDRERVLVLGNLGFEAWREAVDRRRAMLGDAAVATVFSELSAAELGRVERTIRMLDPEDLATLALLDEGEADTDDTDPRALERYVGFVQRHLGGAALTASGCVRRGAVGMGTFEGPAMGVQITPLGELVLRFMGKRQ